MCQMSSSILCNQVFLRLSLCWGVGILLGETTHGERMRWFVPGHQEGKDRAVRTLPEMALAGQGKLLQNVDLDRVYGMSVLGGSCGQG